MSLPDSQWMPRIDHELCTGCRQCVEACPTDAVAQVKGKADLVHPERCTYCLVCEDLCPSNAIELPFLIQFRRKETTNVL